MQNCQSMLRLFSLVVVLIMVPRVSYGGDTDCNGTLTGTYDGINVERGSCTLDGATVNGSVKVSGGGNLIVQGGTEISGDIEVKQGEDVDICGTTIDGALKLSETDGELDVGVTCMDPTELDSILVEKGKGNVQVVGAVTGDSDLVVIEQEGDVMVDGATLSDVTVEKIKGNITLENVMTTSDMTITENDGNVTILDSSFSGDAEIKLNRKVTIKRSSFALEDVKIANNSGRIRVVDNEDLNLSIIENSDVKAKRNTVIDSEISKNTDGVLIEDNTFEKLNCSDNNPAPTGSGNTITELADGQCAGFSTP